MPCLHEALPAVNVSEPCNSKLALSSPSQDQLWGIVARRIASCDSLYHPDDVVKVLQHELATPNMRAWLGGPATVSRILRCRFWKKHVQQHSAVSLYSGLRDDATANHFFLFAQRRGDLAYCNMFCLCVSSVINLTGAGGSISVTKIFQKLWRSMRGLLHGVTEILLT